MLRLYWRPTINAFIGMKKGNSAHAIELLEAAYPYELGGGGGDLYPDYVRGHVYLSAKNGAAAVAEFQKLLDHRGLMVNNIIGSLAHLQIGRAYAMAGETTKAKVAYQEFISQWNVADPDIPVLIAAKAECAKLH